MSNIPEHVAEVILYAAIKEKRAGELLDCLFKGGSCTVDNNGALQLIDGDMLAQFTNGVEED